MAYIWPDAVWFSGDEPTFTRAGFYYLCDQELERIGALVATDPQGNVDALAQLLKHQYDISKTIRQTRTRLRAVQHIVHLDVSYVERRVYEMQQAIQWYERILFRTIEEVRVRMASAANCEDW
ncbi:MAG TPA: hypothetical protein VJ553_05495 [Candidatus Paceibacterota bacterium]|nr:hypothetical protein [Candidatus Paceibacterota bacterium]